MANGQNYSEGRTIYVISLLIGFLSLGLQLGGGASPAWLVVDYNKFAVDFKFSMGLYYVTYCKGGECDADTIDKFWDEVFASVFGVNIAVDHDMLEYQIEVPIAIAFILVAIVCVAKLACCSPNGVYNNSKGYWPIAAVCAALSSALSLTASGKYGRAIADAHNALNKLNLSPYKVPYSLILTGIGGLFAILLFVILLIETFRAYSKMKSMEQNTGFAMAPYPNAGKPYDAQPYGTPPYNSPYYNPPYTGQPYTGNQTKQPYPSTKRSDSYRDYDRDYQSKSGYERYDQPYSGSGYEYRSSRYESRGYGPSDYYVSSSHSRRY